MVRLLSCLNIHRQVCVCDKCVCHTHRQMCMSVCMLKTYRYANLYIYNLPGKAETDRHRVRVERNNL